MGDNTGGALAALLVGGLVLGAAAQSQTEGEGLLADPASTGDVIVSVHSSRAEGVLTHYAECGANINAEPDYEVRIPEAIAYDDIEGDPCPAGTREPTARDKYPELYEEMRDAQLEPLEFAGGDPAKPCGTWEAGHPDDARMLAEECPPLTRGVLD